MIVRQPGDLPLEMTTARCIHLCMGSMTGKASRTRLAAGALAAMGLLTACGDPAQNPETVAADTEAGHSETAALRELPLTRGYYVASDTPCDEASNATVVLLRRDGIGGSRDFCEFKTIEQIGATTYRVTQACADLQSDAPAESSVVTYTLSDETSFTSTSEHGWTYSARHCAQSSMPPDWRANDISDITE